MNKDPLRHGAGLYRLGTFRAALLSGLSMAAVVLAGCAHPDADAEADASETASGSALDSVEWYGPMHEDATSVSSHREWTSWIGREWSGAGDASFHVLRYDCSQGECRPAEELTVDSCEKLFEADARRLDVPGMEEEQARYLKRRLECRAARRIVAAVNPQDSFVSQFSLTEQALRSLPPDLGYPVDPSQIEEMERIRKEAGDLGTFLDDVLGLPRHALETTGEAARASDDDNWTREWLYLARGDFDGDGQGDLLLGVNLYITDESLLFGSRLYVVTRDAEQAPYRVVSRIPLHGEESCDGDTEACATDRDAAVRENPISRAWRWPPPVFLRGLPT